MDSKLPKLRLPRNSSPEYAELTKDKFWDGIIESLRALKHGRFWYFTENSNFIIKRRTKTPEVHKVREYNNEIWVEIKDRPEIQLFMVLLLKEICAVPMITKFNDENNNIGFYSEFRTQLYKGEKENMYSDMVSDIYFISTVIGDTDRWYKSKLNLINHNLWYIPKEYYFLYDFAQAFSNIHENRDDLSLYNEMARIYHKHAVKGSINKDFFIASTRIKVKQFMDEYSSDAGLNTFSLLLTESGLNFDNFIRSLDHWPRRHDGDYHMPKSIDEVRDILIARCNQVLKVCDLEDSKE